MLDGRVELDRAALSPALADQGGRPVSRCLSMVRQMRLGSAPMQPELPHGLRKRASPRARKAVRVWRTTPGIRGHRRRESAGSFGW